MHPRFRVATSASTPYAREQPSRRPALRFRCMRLLLCCILTWLVFGSPAVRAADAVDYLRDIKPLLRERCAACHGTLKQKAKLRVDTAAAIHRGGESGPAVVAKDAGSLLLQRVSDTDPESRMPPEGAALTEKQIATLKAWIDQGATAPADEKPEADPASHWAFRKPVRPAVPEVGNADNPIDRFLAVEHQRRGLTPNSPADKATLLRRVTIDLTGLPPTRDELHTFLADNSTDAYDRVVDRLLASPRYGERWARHWLDVWRYSDWYGRRAVPDVMNSYPQIWRWRDWTVRSLNADKGYDRMVMEMLAADELAPGDSANVVATGFVVRNWFKWNYNQWMRDSVEHTGKAFLGLTFNCCHCHDHKYDPISQQDYFRMRAVFEPLELRHDRVPGEPDPGPFAKYVYGVSYGPIASGLIRVVDEKPDAKTFLYEGGDERNKRKDAPPVAPGVPEFLGGRFAAEPVPQPVNEWYPGQRPEAQRDEVAKRQAAVAATATEYATAMTAAPSTKDVELATLTSRYYEAKLAAARSELAWVTARIAADNARYRDWLNDPKALASTASRAERQFQLDTALFGVARAALGQKQIANKSNVTQAETEAAEKALQTARQVADEKRTKLAGDSAEYTPLGLVYPQQSSGRRLALARWIASSDNPLTARVAVNHIWNWHFGRPIVDSTFDFGRNGKPPSHPELLDWLATELIANGWRTKPLHRSIVMSDAYRMASAELADDPRHKIDPDNRFVWRFRTQRVDAEVVRDGLLHLAGELDITIGGHEIPQDQGQTSRRRSLYFAHHGESRMAMLETFDEANPCDCYRRTASVVPQQALALSNSEMTQRCGRVLATRLSANTDDAAFVRAAFEQVLSRPPTAAEQAAAERFVARQVALFEDVNNEPITNPAGRARENLIIALFNHNDFVTVR
jgi:hypothetical protein